MRSNSLGFESEEELEFEENCSNDSKNRSNVEPKNELIDNDSYEKARNVILLCLENLEVEPSSSLGIEDVGS